MVYVFLDMVDYYHYLMGMVYIKDYFLFSYLTYVGNRYLFLKSYTEFWYWSCIQVSYFSLVVTLSLLCLLSGKC